VTGQDRIAKALSEAIDAMVADGLIVANRTEVTIDDRGGSGRAFDVTYRLRRPMSPWTVGHGHEAEVERRFRDAVASAIGEPQEGQP